MNSSSRKFKTLPSSITGVPDSRRGPGGVISIENEDAVIEFLTSTNAPPFSAPMRSSSSTHQQQQPQQRGVGGGQSTSTAQSTLRQNSPQSANVNTTAQHQHSQRQHQHGGQLGGQRQHSQQQQRKQRRPPSPLISLHQQSTQPPPHLTYLEKERQRRDEEFPILLANVEKAKNFLSTIDKEMELVDEAKRNKLRRQFEDWNIHVHGRIQTEITRTLDNLDKKQLNRKKNEDYQKFLNVTNRKPAIFRDIIIESEYDPLEPNRHCIQAKTGRLHDPPKLGLQKAEREASMLGDDPKKRVKQPLGKVTLDVEQWASGKIEATPYGTFAKMMNKPHPSTASSPNREGSSDITRNATLRSHIFFDHYSYPKGRDVIDAEMPKGKRIYPSVTYTDPGRVFGHLPLNVEQEIAQIQPPEDRRPF